MLIIGIDPGISGSICFFKDGVISDVVEMPTMIEGKKNKKQVNGSQIFNEINERIKKLERYDAILVPAALSDFIPNRSKGKLSSEKIPEIKLKRAKKSIEIIRKKHKGLLCAFKLESGLKDRDLIERGKSLLKYSDVVIANHSKVLGNEKTKIAMITEKENTWIEDTKKNASKKILKDISKRI